MLEVVSGLLVVGIGVWLFGSRARGEARTDSDWDLLVVVPDDLPEREYDWRAAWEVRNGTGVSADVIGCSASDFRDAREIANTLSYEATHFGVLLYER